MIDDHLKEFAMARRKFNLRLGQVLGCVANMSAPGLSKVLAKEIKEQTFSDRIKKILDQWPQYNEHFKYAAGQLFIAHGEMLMVNTTRFNDKEIGSYNAAVLRQENIIQGMLVGKNGFIGEK